MPLETKTDDDWFQIMTQEIIISPIWFLFGKNGEEKTETSKGIIESIQSQFPSIKFYFFDMDQSPGVKSISSVDRVGTNVLYVFGMEFNRFKSISSNVYTAFATLLINNFNSECLGIYSPIEYFINGSKQSTKSGKFNLTVNNFYIEAHGTKSQTFNGKFILTST